MTVSPQIDPPPAARIETRPRKSRAPMMLASLAVILIVGFVIARSIRTGAAPQADAAESLIVAAAKVHRAPVSRELVFDSELRPFQEVDLHAKVAGYVESINVDIGDRVKEGQLIAKLDLPEVRADVDRVIASQRKCKEDIRRAEAAYNESKLAIDRLRAVDKSKPNLIAQSEIDAADAREKSASANLAAAEAQLKAADADVTKLQTMLKYADITVPFDGVITARYADRGALIQAGTSSSGMPLVRVSENRRLRLVFPVSVSFVPFISNGVPVRVEIPGLHKTIDAKITRTSQKVSTATRTMDAEVDLENNDYSLIPGVYAAVRVNVDTRPDALVIPVQAISHGKTPSVYIINAKSEIEERTVKLGIESPDYVEALDGVHDGDLVMIGNRSEVKTGQKVTAKLTTDAPTEK